MARDWWPPRSRQSGRTTSCTRTGQVAANDRGASAWLLRAGVLGAALIVVALLVTGCGGGSSRASVAHIGKSALTTTVPPAAGLGELPNLQQLYQDFLTYAGCMRSHGQPSFPDPELVINAHERAINWGQGVDQSSPQYLSANKTCEHLLPNNGNGPTQGQLQRMMAQALKYTGCMRSHGVPNLPDPKESTGGVSIGGPGLDPKSPQFQTAQRDCRSFLPGGGP
jgi:hypothetical protein